VDGPARPATPLAGPGRAGEAGGAVDGPGRAGEAGGAGGRVAPVWLLLLLGIMGSVVTV
jgi:hypothetical protein